MRYEIPNQWSRLLPAVVLFGGLLFAVPLANAQEQPLQVSSTENSSQEAGNNSASMTTSEKAVPILIPVFSNYKGITIGMSADQVRQKLDHLKDKGAKQDFFVFSDHEWAQVYYDGKGLVKVISVDYIGKDSEAPDVMTVLGEEVPAKANGAMYKLIRYPSAKYWVSYNRTAGDSPIVTVTMQKMR